ncbi:MAG: GTP 3',8-cyclase MoaA [Planctomycetes bacterium]|nr:GTP 3',8-cyclase MoaA [Planctomycetota bacterium]
MTQNVLIDNYGRRINYLRISVTDRCNFRCRYCRPAEPHPALRDAYGGAEDVSLLRQDELLSYEEIMQVVRAAIKLGVTKFRITGGEPLTRPGIIGFLQTMAGTPGVEWLSLTTNGFFVKQYAHQLGKIGLNGINISVNSLKDDTFSRLTGVAGLGRVWEGIEALLQSGQENIKLNTVLMRGFNDDEALDFACLTINRPIVIRFIEYMPCGNWQGSGFDQTIPAEDLIDRISAIGRLIPVNKQMGNGPARYYQLLGARGLIGFITPVSQPFCERCNRLRLTADGHLKPCLLSTESVDLKPVLRHGEGNLNEAFSEATSFKPRVHQEEQLNVMSRIGG